MAFNTYAAVSAIVDDTIIKTYVYKRDPSGTETELFTVTTPPLISTTVLPAIKTSVQPDFSVDPSDRLVFKYYVSTSSVTDVSISFYHGGNDYYTYVNTPLATRHNDLSGLQGGLAVERYHITAAEAVVVGNTSGVNTGDQDLSGYATTPYVNSTFFRESSIGSGLEWNNTTHKLDVSVGGTNVTLAYVDGSLAARDVSISWLNANKVNDASLLLYATNASIGAAGFTTDVSVNLALTNYRTWTDTKFYIDGSFNKRDLSINQLYQFDALKATKVYVDGSLALRDVSIAWLNTNKANITALNPFATNASTNLAFATRDASIVSIKSVNISQDASIVILRNYDITINASLGLRPLTTYVDGSLNLKVNRILFDSSIAALTTKNINQDTSINNNALAIAAMIYGTQYQLASSLTASTTSATTPQTKVTMTTTNLPAGTYKITANWTWTHSSAASDALFDLTLNGTPQGTQSTINIESQDPTSYYPEVRIFYLSLSGINTILLRYWNESNDTTISDATIELIRVS